MSIAKLIVLVGMPGCGKSTVGRHLARRLGVEFTDLDVVIEAELGVPIREFFEREGEERFRAIESESLKRWLENPRGVLATGGGTVLTESNRLALRSTGVCIYLRSSLEELFRRLRRDTRRPLLQVADPLARLRELHATRDPLYRATAHHVIDTGRPSVSMLVNMVVMQLEMEGHVEPHARSALPGEVGIA